MSYAIYVWLFVQAGSWYERQLYVLLCQLINRRIDLLAVRGFGGSVCQRMLILLFYVAIKLLSIVLCYVMRLVGMVRDCCGSSRAGRRGTAWVAAYDDSIEQYCWHTGSCTQLAIEPAIVCIANALCYNRDSVLVCLPSTADLSCGGCASESVTTLDHVVCPSFYFILCHS